MGLQNKKLSVVIVAYKNIKVLEDCINSIFKYNDIDDMLEIIVVDNSEEYDLFNYMKETYKNIKIIKSINNGFGAGNNLGVKHSNGEYLMFLNPDTILIEPIFKDALKRFEKYPDIGVFGYRLLDNKLQRNYSYGSLDKFGFLNRAVFNIMHKLELFDAKNMFIIGADMLIKKSIFEEIRGFDENMFMYMEEADITRQVKSLGKKIYYFSDKSIIHLEGKTSGNNLKMYSIWLESFKYYCRKYDLSYKKSISKEINSNKIKLILSKIFRKKEKELYYKNVLSILKQTLDEGSRV